MLVRLLTPARTPVAFPKAWLETRSEANRRFHSALGALAGELPFPVSLTTHVASSDKELRYNTLDDDSFSRAASPVATFDLEPGAFEAAMGEDLAAKEWTITKASLAFYSHHICISDIGLSIPDASLSALDPAGLEERLSAFALAMSASHWEVLSSLVARRLPKASSQRYDCLSPQGNRLQALWTNRTYLLSANERKSATIRRLTRYDLVRSHGVAIGDYAYVYEGNNLVFDEALLPDFIKGMSSSQCIFSVMSNLLDAFEDVTDFCSAHQDIKSVRKAIDQAEALDTLFSFYQIEMKTIPLNLQLARKATFETATRYYGIEGITEAIEIRSRLLAAQIERAVQKSQFLSNRIVQASLVIISFLQVVSTFTDTYTMAEGRGYPVASDGPGLLALPGLIGFNWLINIAILATLAVALFATYRRGHK